MPTGRIRFLPRRILILLFPSNCVSYNFLSPSARHDVLSSLWCAAPRQSDILSVYDRLESSLNQLTVWHDAFVERSARTVESHLQIFRTYSVSQRLVGLIEAFRALSCAVLCPGACTLHGGDVSQALVVRRLNNLQLDFELLLNIPDVEVLRHRAQQQLRLAKRVMMEAASSALLDKAFCDEALRLCIQAPLSTLVKVLEHIPIISVIEQKYTLVSGVDLRQRAPASLSPSHINPVPFTGFGDTARDGELSLSFLQRLAGEPVQSWLTSEPVMEWDIDDSVSDIENEAVSHFCLLSSSTAGAAQRWVSTPELLGTAADQRQATVTHVILHLMSQIAEVLDLSHAFVAFRPFRDEESWTSKLSCTGEGVLYDPTLCLRGRVWDYNVYSVDSSPPYRAHVEQVLGGGEYHMDIDVNVPSFDDVMAVVDGVWRRSTEVSPDVLFLHPAVHNCGFLKRFFTMSAVTAKIVVVPINPLISPPLEVAPVYDAFWQKFCAGNDCSYESHEDPKIDDHVASRLWLSQCSLAAVEEIMRRLAVRNVRYVFQRFDAGYATYLRQDLSNELGLTPAGPPSLFQGWLQGWFCLPQSRYWSRLEFLGGPEMMLLSQPTLPDQAKHVTLCKFMSRHGITVEDMNVECPEVWDSDLLMQFLPGRDVQLRAWAIAQEKEIPGMRYTLQSSGRGRCVQSFCECFPPYRGPLCDFEEGGFHVARNFSAVLHYLTSDMEEDVDELTHSLPRLWKRFNARFDYPVVIFHDGLSEKNRRRIVLSSKNRIWVCICRRVS